MPSITSLVLPGLTTPLTDSTLDVEAAQISSSVKTDQLSLLGNPAALLDHLRFLEARNQSRLYRPRHIQSRAVYRSPSLTSVPKAASWLDDAMRSIGRGFTDSQPEVSQSIDFKSGELRAWRLDIHDTSGAERPLLTIHITLQSLMLSTAVILLLGLIGSRWITRPIQCIEEQLLAIHNRRAHKLVPPRGNCSDFESLIQTVTDYVEDQQESRSRAGYAASLLEQVISTIETAIMVVDDNGTLRFSNRSGRRQFKLGTHPNAWSHLAFAQDPEIQAALIESRREHHGVPIHNSSALPPSTVIHAIIRGNDTPWMLFTADPSCDELRPEPRTSPLLSGLNGVSENGSDDVTPPGRTKNHAVY